MFQWWGCDCADNHSIFWSTGKNKSENRGDDDDNCGDGDGDGDADDAADDDDDDDGNYYYYYYIIVILFFVCVFLFLCLIITITIIVVTVVRIGWMMVIWMARQLVPRAVPVGWIALLKLYPLCLRGRSDLHISHWDPTISHHPCLGHDLALGPFLFIDRFVSPWNAALAMGFSWHPWPEIPFPCPDFFTAGDRHHKPKVSGQPRGTITSCS